MYLGYNFNAVIPNKNILSTTDQESLSFERMERAKDFLIAVKQFIGKELDFEHYAARLDWSSYSPYDVSSAAAQFDLSSYCPEDVSLAAAQFRWYSYFALI